MDRLLAAGVFFVYCAAAQTTNTGSVSGTVVSEKGSPLRAVLIAQPAGIGSPVLGRTGLDGSFTMQLPAGKYAICPALIPADQSTSTDPPFLNPRAAPAARTRLRPLRSSVPPSRRPPTARTRPANTPSGTWADSPRRAATTPARP
jgi:hypothetical protein